MNLVERKRISRSSRVDGPPILHLRLDLLLECLRGTFVGIAIPSAGARKLEFQYWQITMNNSVSRPNKPAIKQIGLYENRGRLNAVTTGILSRDPA